MFAGLEGFTTEMVIICVLISVVTAFLYVYRKRVKSEYKTNASGVTLKPKAEKPQKQIKPSGSKNDYLQLVSGLVSVSRKHNWPIIAPAVVEAKGSYTQLVALIATPEIIIGVCAFGHGGTIVAGGGMQDWTQRVNGQENKIKSPLKTMQNAEDVLTKAMQTLGLGGQPFVVLGAYTHPDVTLQGAVAEQFHTTESLLTHLRAFPVAPEQDVDCKQTIEKLRTVVLKPEKASKKK